MSATVQAAVQAALAAEQRARFGYGVLGPQLGASAVGLARGAQSDHEQLIADTTAALSTAGAQPDPPAADYPDVYPVASPADAMRLAVRLEQDAARAWRFAYAAAASASSTATGGGSSSSKALSGDPFARAVRPLAQRALTGSAVRATQWRLQAQLRPATEPFPGI